MKVVIDIPDDDYEYIKLLHEGLTDYQTTLKLYRAVKNGKPFEERPQGEWIDCGEYYRCPFCSNWVLTVDGKPNYCDECGADMRGKEKNDT
jgi:hypothetical protein